MVDNPMPTLGSRLSYSGNLGTVKFVGPVDGTQGIWIGVEWDDAQRGKHDGVKDGKRYFSCLVPNAGSFIRLSPSISYGTSFLKALESKYIETPHSFETPEKVLLGSSNGSIEVEAVGLNKIRGKLSDLERLREVSLDNEGVATSDKAGEILKACPGIRGLDISRSLLPSWDMVAMIASQLPLLERLALNQNRLQLPKDDVLMSRAFPRLRELLLSATMMTWQDLEPIIDHMPNLQLVELGHNRWQQLSSSVGPPGPTHGHPAIQVINLDSNELHSWSDVCRALSSYSALQRLILSSNRIETIDPITESATSTLKHLSLSFNNLRTWSHIDRLGLWCPVLESLTLTGNPLVEDLELGKNARQFAIARIPSLLTLDGAPVSSKERIDSEIFYLSYVSKHGPADEESKCREHPRWRELCSKHGRPDDPLPKSKLKPDTLGGRLIQVYVYQTSGVSPRDQPKDFTPDCGSTQATPLRVLPSMLTRAFRAKVAKSFGLNTKEQQRSMRMWLKMPDGDLAEVDITHDTHDLAWWGFEDSSEVVISTNNS